MRHAMVSKHSKQPTSTGFSLAVTAEMTSTGAAAFKTTGDLRLWGYVHGVRLWGYVHGVRLWGYVHGVRL